ncbi:MAG: hypothetical protein ABWJ90_10850 [Thermus sp.]|uniref:hypothetical protein n=1 Tax=unclassified Thermus TaxID=2619321 RepID=UPI0006902D36|nr:hypothetical protein [Thermus sp. 2.9]
MRALLAGLLLFLAGCLPVAVLRDPEPVRGVAFSVGGSLFPSLSPGSQYPVWALPYVALAQGDGRWEWNLSLQWSLRLGGKVALAEGFSLDGGLSLWPSGEGQRAFSADLGLLLGGGGGTFPLEATWPWTGTATWAWPPS